MEPDQPLGSGLKSQETKLSLHQTSSQHAIVGDLLVYFRERRSVVRPYLSVGVGAVRLELGAAPGYSGNHAAIAFPVKACFSLGNYYELAGEDNTFGFVSVGATANVPLGGRSLIGRWHVH